MSAHPNFRVDIYQNEYLHQGATEVNAIVTVTSGGRAGDSGGSAIAADASGGAAGGLLSTVNEGTHLRLGWSQSAAWYAGSTGSAY